MIEEISIKGHKFLLYPEKAMLWESKKLLLISDMHLGKINHFRSSGIAVPHAPNVENMERLIALLQRVKPESVLFMGDLFHSHYNEEWEVYGQVLQNFPTIFFELLLGNHDIMSDYQYQKHKLVLHREPLIMAPFIFSHKPMETHLNGQRSSAFAGAIWSIKTFQDSSLINKDYYNIAGHIHPGVHLRGKGKQGLKLPCFCFSKNHALLPAFGAFTGLHKISPQEEDNIFVIVEDRVMRVA